MPNNWALAYYSGEALSMLGLPVMHNELIQESNLEGYNLVGVNLRKANFWETNLSKTNLEVANLVGAES